MWLRRSYVVTNQSADELLNFEDCMTPMDRLNLKISHQQIMEIFQAAGITRTLSGLYALDMKDIHRFYALLSERPALKDIFRQYPSVLHNFWTVNDLENFLFIEQEARDDKCDPGPSLVETCEWMIQTFDPIQEHRAHKLLSLGGKYYRMDNTAESNKRTRVSNTRDDFVRHCAQHLVRIYPAGIRTDSCSMNPFPGMDAGCQIVAINYQDKSKETQIYRAFFGNNGGCGYILKPEHMRNITSEPGESRRIQLTVRVISAQQLPKVPVAGEKEISDPFVFVEIYGCPEDCEVMSTTPAKNNGFNPVWNKEFSFDIRNVDLAVLRIEPRDTDFRNRCLIAQYDIPVTCVQQENIDEAVTMFIVSDLMNGN
ncbi:1-phosphatidylinositol 4,5-bisphosphate phosphodiesterase delta-4-like [Paramacrobiotus metropolitanus]|uniref:1-phosphatidylinositol 4,5-bisphosphate phosphodiesterase delta-4-like n=1 Tax=Paramacrobiotus metropolitanus TaxID=2943436 RepID=UPI0024461A4F|nr:1-phosphatidylinositol 4,5-bisphosphate phosphodiesterase delta-4-like [Paramacrobiotus metropolitanus]